MPKQSAGILLYKFDNDSLFVFLVHMGGPFWEKKDKGAWTIPKGEFNDDEDSLSAARREFEEETGFPIDGRFIKLSPVKQSNKMIYAWAVEGDCDASRLRSNLFQIEWPPKSGKIRSYPEVDRAAWFSPDIAKRKIVKSQQALIDQLSNLVLKNQ